MGQIHSVRLEIQPAMVEIYFVMIQIQSIILQVQNRLDAIRFDLLRFLMWFESGINNSKVVNELTNRRINYNKIPIAENG